MVGSEGGLRGPLYLDASALVKLFLPEVGSAELNAALAGRGDVMISDLAITEMVSALRRRQREDSMAGNWPTAARGEVLRTVERGGMACIELLPEIHRDAEMRLLRDHGPVLRGMDALHLALAHSAGAATLVGYDRRLREAARAAGLAVFPDLD